MHRTKENTKKPNISRQRRDSMASVKQEQDALLQKKEPCFREQNVNVGNENMYSRYKFNRRESLRNLLGRSLFYIKIKI